MLWSVSQCWVRIREQVLRVISCVGLICRWLHSPFLNHPDLHSHYKQSEWNWSAFCFSVGVAPGSPQVAMTSCAVSAALTASTHSRLCILCVCQVMWDFSATHLIKMYRFFFVLCIFFIVVLGGFFVGGFFCCCLWVFLVSFGFFFCLFSFLALKIFTNLLEARYTLPHIWSIELELPGQ